MALYKDEGAILKGQDLGEYDRILTIFGQKTGKFSAIAKGVRKLTSRKRGHLQTFSISRFSIAEGKSLDIIVEAENLFSLDTEMIDTETFERIGFAGMVLDKLLPEGVPEKKIYGWWSEYIEGHLDDTSTKQFVLRTLVELGFMPPERAFSF